MSTSIESAIDMKTAARSKTVQVRVTEVQFEELKAIAEADRRSLSDYLYPKLLKLIEEERAKLGK